MKQMQSGVLVLALLAGLGPLGSAQHKPLPTQPAPAPGAVPEAAALTVDVVSRIPSVDRENLKNYWTGVESRTKERWMQGLPADAKPPESAAGQVKITAIVHTDGRVTNVAVESSAGKASLDRAARLAIMNTAPFDAFPYGIATDAVKVRFTFVYNGGAAPPPAPSVQ
jgi:TonB family protein